MIATGCVVLYKHTESQLIDLFDSIQNSDLAGSVIVIDNSPTNCIEQFAVSYGLTYKHTPKNPGFGVSHNYGFSFFDKSDIHFILNPDISFSVGVITGITRFFHENDDLAMVSPKILYPDGRLQRLCKLLPNPLNLFSRRFCPPIAKWLDYNFELQWFDYQSQADIPYLSGCFMAIRSSAFSSIGGFDEHFFMYLEDTDLCRRLLKLGRLVFNPDFTVVHVFEKASYKNSKLLRAHLASAIYYFNKWGWMFDLDRRWLNRKTVQQLKKSN